jgi:capsular exopolysaccharide synthesis family protein
LPVSLGLADASLNSFIGELMTLSQEKNKIAISSTEKNPYYSVIENDIAATKKAAIAAVQNSLNISRLAMTEINNKIGEIESKVNKLPKKERQLLEIQRKFNISDDVYNFLLQKKAEASIAKASNISDNKFIDRAELVAKIHPNKSRNYLIALLLGILIPFLILFIREYLNETVKDKKDIDDNSKLTLLGSIAHSNQKTELALIENPRALIAETIRILRSNLDFVFVNAKKDEGKIITLTSAISAEGKTFCAINIACAFAISDKKTLLIGADLRKPKIFKDFDLTNTIGLSSYLIGKSSLEEIINETNIKDLSIITAGPVPPNPSELLGSDKFIELLSVLRKKFDYIIFDTPPVGLVSDAVSVMKYSDTILYILRQNFTSKKVLIELNDFVSTTGLKNIYLVLNNILYKKNKYGKYYGRYGYSGYGYTYSGYYYEE